MHEHTPRHLTPVKGSSNRSFGLVFTACFVILAVFPLFYGRETRWWALLVAAVFLTLALMYPTVLGPFNRGWTKLGELLHRIVSPIALGVLFFGVVTPTALLMRLFGKDQLRRTFDKNVSTYWIERDPPGPAAESLKNQF